MKNYSLLEKQFARIYSLEHALSILGWDRSVMMPDGSGEARGSALAEISVLRHEILVSSQVFDLLQAAELEGRNLNAWQKANLTEIKKTVLQARAVSAELVEAQTLASSRCELAWRSMRAENNWNDFLPLLEKVVHLSQEEASQRSAVTGLSAYDCLLDLYSPGINSEEINGIFNQLKSFLPDLIKRISEKQKNSVVLQPNFEIPIEKQKRLGIEVMKVLGFNFGQGRLDVSHHPFCGGVPEDVRLTTRYKTNNFIESLMGVIHETGHACYEQGLPREWVHQPVGKARGMHIHESQSLLFEIFIGRSQSFLEYLHPLICKNLELPQEAVWSKGNMYQLFNTVKPDYIRVDADEVTYPAHVILRYEIEKALIENKIQVRDIPDLWNEKMQKYLGISTVGNFKNGCMQDSHWPGGAFGYFPSYSLGALTAAQLFFAIEKSIPNVHLYLQKGDLRSVREWLSQHIWAQGCQFSAKDMLINSTGESLNAHYFKTYIEGKYLSDSSITLLNQE